MGNWLKLYWNIHTVESHAKYSTAVQRNAVILYILTGRHVQDLWTDAKRNREVVYFCFLSNIFSHDQ